MINEHSQIAQDILAAGKNTVPIIDMHAHMGNHGGGLMIARTPEQQLYYMDQANVKVTVFAGHSGLFVGARGVKQDLEVAKRFKGRYRLYYPVVAPLLHTYANLDDMAANSEYVGFKFLCDYYKVPLSDPRHTPYLEYANRHRMPVLVHTWGHSQYDGIEEAEKILDRYPNLSFLAAHCFHGETDRAVQLAQKYPNLYLELTAMLTWKGPLEAYVAAGLTKRLLFGVDAPWFSYYTYLGSLLSADITDEDRRDILYRNALGVFKKAGICINSGFEDECI